MKDGVKVVDNSQSHTIDENGVKTSTYSDNITSETVTKGGDYGGPLPYDQSQWNGNQSGNESFEDQSDEDGRAWLHKKDQEIKRVKERISESDSDDGGMRRSVESHQKSSSSTSESVETKQFSTETGSSSASQNIESNSEWLNSKSRQAQENSWESSGKSMSYYDHTSTMRTSTTYEEYWYLDANNNKVIGKIVYPEIVKKVSFSDSSQSSDQYNITRFVFPDVRESLAKVRRDEDQADFITGMFTTSSGYSARMRVSIRGVGSGFGTHMSVLLRLMPGKNDNNLRWPCEATFRVSLKSSAENKDQFHKDIPFTFYVEASRRPKKDVVHKDWGRTRFLEHKALEEYLQEDGSLVVTCQSIT